MAHNEFHKHEQTVQELQNRGFDPTFDVPTAEILGFDDGNNALRRIAVDANGKLEMVASIDTSALALESGGNLATIANATKLEDSTHSSGDRGMFILGVRNEGHDDFSGTDKDYIPIGVDATGDVYTNVRHLPATPAGTNFIGKLLPPDIDITTHTNYVRKYYTNAGAVTDGIVWSPAAGKRWHIVSLSVHISADATITLEDDKSGGDDVVWKGEFAGKSGTYEVYDKNYPLASGEDAADLLVTTSAGNIYITITGYEI